MGWKGEERLSVLGSSDRLSGVYPPSTFLGENTPTVPPSSRMATPISAKSASLWKDKGKKKNVYMLALLWQHVFCSVPGCCYSNEYSG